MHRREFLGLAGATLATGFSTQARSQAQSWPSKPVKLILPYAPGGATDLIGRPWPTDSRRPSASSSSSRTAAAPAA
jgi:hypothetical protein